MTSLEQDLVDMTKRYRTEVRELERSVARLDSAAERSAAKTHAHVKSACASEISRILQRHGVKVVA